MQNKTPSNSKSRYRYHFLNTSSSLLLNLSPSTTPIELITFENIQVEKCLTSMESSKHDDDQVEDTTKAQVAQALKVLEIQRAMLSALKPRFGNFRDTIGKAVNVCSRSGIRPLKILTEIFKRVRRH